MRDEPVVESSRRSFVNSKTCEMFEKEKGNLAEVNGKVQSKKSIVLQAGRCHAKPHATEGDSNWKLPF